MMHQTSVASCMNKC